MIIQIIFCWVNWVAVEVILIINSDDKTLCKFSSDLLAQSIVVHPHFHTSSLAGNYRFCSKQRKLRRKKKRCPHESSHDALAPAPCSAPNLCPCSALTHCPTRGRSCSTDDAGVYFLRLISDEEESDIWYCRSRWNVSCNIIDIWYQHTMIFYQI